MSVSKIIRPFIDHFYEQYKANIMHLSLLREDGIFIYKKSSRDQNEKNEESIGALSAGIWQAAVSQVKYSHPEYTHENFKFSFDQSDAGIHILALKCHKKLFLLYCEYKKTINPAKLKNKLGRLAKEIKSQIEEIKSFEIVHRKEYLFDSISDEEIDKLFSFVRDECHL